MSMEENNPEIETTENISWKQLIEDAKARLEACQRETEAISKSIAFFKKQEMAGKPSPVNRVHRHGKLSR